MPPIFSITFSNQQGKLIIKHSNSSFYLPPVLGKISNVFVLPEGLLIEIDLHAWTEINELRDLMIDKKAQHNPTASYFTLCFHPLADFRPLYANPTTPFVKFDEFVVFSSSRLPLIGTFDRSNHEIVIYLAEYSFEEAVLNKITTGFDKTVHIVDGSDPQFINTVFKANPFVVLREIFRRKIGKYKPKQVEIVESVKNAYHLNEKTFYFYVLEETESFCISVIETRFKLCVDEKRFCVAEECKFIGEFKHVRIFWTTKFFEDCKNLLRTKNYFKKKKNVPPFPEPIEGKLNIENFSDVFSQVERSLIKKLMLTKLNKNSIAFQLEDKICIAYGNKIIYEFPQSFLITTPFKIISFERNIVKATAQEAIRYFPLPNFFGKLFKILLGLLFNFFDNNFAVGLIQDLFSFLIYFRVNEPENTLFKVSEFEVIATYFTVLFTATKEGESVSLALPDLGYNAKRINFSEENVFHQMQALSQNKGYEELSKLVKKSFPNLTKTFSNNFSRILHENFPFPSIDLKQFSFKKLELFNAFHFLNEECRILKTKKNIHDEVSILLFLFTHLSTCAKSKIYTQYYLSTNSSIISRIKKSPVLVSLMDAPITQNALDPLTAPFDILQTIYKVLEDKGKIEQYLSSYKFMFLNSYNIIKLIVLLKAGPRGSPKLGKERLENALPHEAANLMLPLVAGLRKRLQKEMRKNIVKRRDLETQQFGETNLKLFDKVFKFFLNNNITLTYIETHCDGLEYIYKNVLRITRKEFRFFLKNPDLPKNAYQLLSREDVDMNHKLNPSTLHMNIKTVTSLNNLGRESVSSHCDYAEERSFFSKQNCADSVNPDQSGKKGKSASKGPEGIDETMLRSLNQLTSRNLHFSKDDVVFKELYKSYNCSEQIVLGSRHTSHLLREENSDERTQEELNKILHKFVYERLSAFVARGAVDFNTESTSLTELIRIPEVNLKFYIKENCMSLSYSFNAENPEDRSAMIWADFHNGVAAALKLSRNALERLDRESIRTWIDYQRTETTRYDHAGLLFGLGLQGLFECFTTGDIYANFKTCNDARIIGTIFGLAIPKLFSKKTETEETILKAFNLHLEFNYLTPEFKISRIIQSAALIAIGIYHHGLSKKSFTETMLVQIAAKAINENNSDRECYSLAAGFALGLLNLGKGSKIPSVQEANIDERLFRYIEGGQIESKPSTKPINPNNVFFSEKKGDFQPSNVLESTHINTQVTAPSALIALMLIHMKTSNKIISSRIAIPSTLFEVIYANPFHTFLKVLARNLIEWDSIKISSEFVRSAVPETIRFIHDNDFPKIFEKYQLNPNFANLDYQVLTMLYHFITAASIFSLCLKFAGTADTALKRLVVKQIKTFQKIPLLEKVFAFDHGVKNQLDSYTYNQILCILSFSLSILMAGYCDIESFKLINELKSRLRRGKGVSGEYGFNLALEMAAGFLFLGNGSYTFGNKNFQIACLLMATYPIFPTDINDNKYHLQTLRHFYVLASEENLFNLLDVDTMKPVQLTVQVESISLQGELRVETKLTPLFLKSTNIWRKLKILNEDFHRLDFRFDQSQAFKPKYLFVKRKFLFDVDLKKLEKQLNSLVQKQEFLLVDFKSKYIQTLVDFAHQNVAKEDLALYISCLYNAFKNDKRNVAHVILVFLSKSIPFKVFKFGQDYAIQIRIIVEFSKFLKGKNRKFSKKKTAAGTDRATLGRL